MPHVPLQIPSLRVAGALIILAVFGTASACSSRNAPATSSPPEQSSASEASTSPSTTPSANSDVDSWKDADPSISPQANQRYGDEGALAATTAAVRFSKRVFYDNSCTALKTGVEATRCLRSLSKYMDRSSQVDWKKNVDGFLADPDDKNQTTQNVRSISFYAAMTPGIHHQDGHSYQAVPDGQYFSHRAISSVSTSVDNDGERLDVTVKATAVFRRLVDGKVNEIALPRMCTYYMSSVNGEWLIDGWRGTWKATKASRD